MLVAIAGGSASGKSTLAGLLKEHYGKRAVLVYQDNYYLPHTHIEPEKRKLINYDCPEAFDTKLLVRQLGELKSGIAVEAPLYDYCIHDRQAVTQTVIPSDIIILDGILVLYDEPLRRLIDISAFVSLDSGERLKRRAERDFSQRCRPYEETQKQFFDSVDPMHNRYIEPERAFADIVIDGRDISGEYRKLIELIDERFQKGEK